MIKIVLATGIYPPDIGGPATYVETLAGELRKSGHQVIVISYQSGKENGDQKESNTIFRVSKSGGPLLRWWRYAQALKKHGSDADIVIAFSSVSCGIPLRIAALHKPKQILRLGGDFFWERYTAIGGTAGLSEWHEGRMGRGFVDACRLWITRLLNDMLMPWILREHDHIVYSTEYQKRMHEAHYSRLPPSSVIENAVPSGTPQLHRAHTPLRLLSMGRFVGFKNLIALLQAMKHLPDVRLSLVGLGPMKNSLQVLAQDLGDRVMFHQPVKGREKDVCFTEHDLLIIPSITEISPNVALEARSVGLPVLLTRETGLSDALTMGMVKAELRTPEDIVSALQETIRRYDMIAEEAASLLQHRDWNTLGKEWIDVFATFDRDTVSRLRNTTGTV